MPDVVMPLESAPDANDPWMTLTDSELAECLHMVGQAGAVIYVLLPMDDVQPDHITTTVPHA